MASTRDADTVHEGRPRAPSVESSVTSSVESSDAPSGEPPGEGSAASVDSAPAVADGQLHAGPFVLLKEMARGGFGVVYRAIHSVLGTPVAVKVMHPELSSSPGVALRFEREVLAIRRLAHPNVVEVFECGRLADGRPYFAMELLKGSSLDEHMARRGRLSIDEALAILTPLADAIDAAHAEGVIHRDIKASNVFLCSDGPEPRVVLLDFGVAKLLDNDGPSLTASRQIVGTPIYMAPEQWLAASIDGRVDVFALGVLTYILLTGHAPFDSGVAGSLASGYSRPRPPSQRAHIHPALDEPIMAALAKNPEDRPPRAGVFVAALREGAARARAPRPEQEPSLERQGIGIYAEIKAEPSLLEEPDDALLLDLEALLPLVAALLSTSGLSIAAETGNNLLMVVPNPIDKHEALLLERRVVDAAVSAKRRAAGRPMADPRVSVGLVVGRGALVITEDGALQLHAGGLLDPALWVPAHTIDGVLVERAMAEELGLAGAPVDGAPGFLAI